MTSNTTGWLDEWPAGPALGWQHRQPAWTHHTEGVCTQAVPHPQGALGLIQWQPCDSLCAGAGSHSRQASNATFPIRRIVFIDEIDKIVHGTGSRQVGSGVSSEGVQRDLLPIIEGGWHCCCVACAPRQGANAWGGLGLYVVWVA